MTLGRAVMVPFLFGAGLILVFHIMWYVSGSPPPKGIGFLVGFAIMPWLWRRLENCD